MNSPQVPNSADQLQGIDTSDGSAELSPARTIAVVAALVSFALVDLTTHANSALDEPSPEFDVAIAIATRGAGDPGVALGGSVLYSRPHASLAGSGSESVVNSVGIQAAPAQSK